MIPPGIPNFNIFRSHDDSYNAKVAEEDLQAEFHKSLAKDEVVLSAAKEAKIMGLFKHVNESHIDDELNPLVWRELLDRLIVILNGRV